jgi:hypothetical protein
MSTINDRLLRQIAEERDAEGWDIPRTVRYAVRQYNLTAEQAAEVSAYLTAKQAEARRIAADQRWSDVDRLTEEANAADRRRGNAAVEAMATAGAAWVATHDLGGDWVDEDGGPVRGHRLMVGGRKVAERAGDNPGAVAGCAVLGLPLPDAGDWAAVDRLRAEINPPVQRPDPVEAFRQWWAVAQAMTADARRAEFWRPEDDVRGAAQAAGLTRAQRRELL